MKPLLHRSCGLLTALAGCLALPAHAQQQGATAALPASTPAPAPTQLAPVTVDAPTSPYQVSEVSMGPLGEKPILDTPYSVSVVDSDLAENQQLQSVREAFRFIPSVQGENIRPQSRGLQAGVVQNTRIDGLNIAATTDYPIEEFQQIEVLNGLAGALYGPASPAGTFDYILKRPTVEPLRQFTLSYTSKRSFEQHMDLGGRFGSDQRYGYRINLLNQNGESYADDSRLKRRLASVGFDIHFTPDAVLENDASYYRYHTEGLPGTFALARNVAFPSAPDPTRLGYGQPGEGDNNVTRIVSSRFKQDFSPDWHVSAGLLHESNDRRSTVPTNTLTNNSGAYTTTTVTTTFSADTILSNSVALNGHLDTGPLTHDVMLASNGFDWSRYTPYDIAPITLGKASLGDPKVFPAPQLPDFAAHYHAMETHQQSATLGDTIGWGPQWSLLLAASQSWIDVDNYSAQGATTSRYDANGISPTGSLMFKPTPESMAYLTYADSLQQGDIAPFGAANAGQSLAPYRSRQWELGYKANVEGVNLTAALFRIQRPYAYIGTTDNVFAEQGKQVNRGIELGANGNLGSAFTLYGNISLLDPKLFDTGSASTSGKQILGLSRVVYNTLLEYHVPVLPSLTFSLNVTHAGQRPADYANSYFVSGYTVTDVGARYFTRIGGQAVTWRLTVDNLSNRRYWANITPSGQNGYNSTGSGTGTLGTPRSIRASMQWDFL